MMLLNQAIKLLPLLSMMALAVDTTGEAASRLRKVEEKIHFVKKDTLGRGRELSNYDELFHIFNTANSDNPGQITDYVQQKLQLNFARKPPSESGDERTDDSSGAVFPSEFFCDRVADPGIVAQYPGRDLCLYLGDELYEDYDTILGCYCTDSAFASTFGGEPSVDCECVMMFLFETPDDSLSLICRSVSIVPTAANDGIFQLQYDCSNVFEFFPDDYFEPCAGVDQDGNCFDKDSVPNPSDEPVITGSFADLTCLPDRLPSDFPPPFADKFQCNSPISPPPGFPYPGTDSFVALLCNTTQVSNSCDCFVSVTFPPSLDTICSECLIIPTGFKLSTYNISFDCSNFYDVGDCVGVDAGGNCISAAGDGQGVESSVPATSTNPPTAPSFTPPPTAPSFTPPPTAPSFTPPPTAPSFTPPPTAPSFTPPPTPSFTPPPTAPPIGGQDVLELVTGTWSGLTSSCVVETDDGPVDLDETGILAWICDDGFVSGFSLHGRDAITGDPLLTLAFAGFSVDTDTVNGIVFYDVRLTNADTGEDAGLLPFDVVYLPADDQFGENLLAYMGTGTACEVLLFPDPVLEEDIATLDYVCQT